MQTTTERPRTSAGPAQAPPTPLGGVRDPRRSLDLAATGGEPRQPPTLPTGVPATLRLAARVAVLRCDRGSCGAWSAAACGALVQALSELGGRPDIDALVLRGPGLFDCGAASSEAAEPALQSVLRAVAAAGVPVLAVIEGDATGAGLELALACAGRVAGRRSRFSLPGIGVGRLPVNGAVQQLPLLIGFPDAVRMIVFGETFDATAALRIGLVDGLEVRERGAFALNRSCERARWGRRHLTPAEKARAAADLMGVARGLRREAPGEGAPLAALRAMEAVIGLSEPAGAAETRRHAEKLFATEEAEALRYAAATAEALRRPGAWSEAALDAQVRWPLLREAVHLLDEGASPAQVDRCLVGYGFAEGPLAQSDRLGLAEVFPAQDGAGGRSWLTYSPTLDLMMDACRTGGAGVSGWYQASDDPALPLRADPGLEKLLQASATFQRIHRHPVEDAEVVRRCLYAALNGSVALVSAIPGLDGSALDAVWTTRLGFPRWKGGPLFQARRIGLEALAADVDGRRPRRDTAGAPSPGLSELLAEPEPARRRPVGRA